MVVRYTLGKAERLSHDTDIQALFRHGKALSCFPVRMLWLLVPARDGVPSVRAGFTAPKKSFRRSVDRARAKRLLRESWRLQRHLVAPAVPEGLHLHVFLILTAKALPGYDTVFKATGKLLKQLGAAVNPGA